jgi:hypothetical protein
MNSLQQWQYHEIKNYFWKCTAKGALNCCFVIKERSQIMFVTTDDDFKYYEGGIEH